MMHVDTHYRYVHMYLAAKYRRTVFSSLSIRCQRKVIHQQQKNLGTELMQLPTMRMKTFLSFKAVHNVKQMLLHRPLYFQVNKRDQLALPTQIMQDFYIVAMMGCQLFYPKSLRILSWLCLFFLFIICQSSCQGKKDW